MDSLALFFLGVIAVCALLQGLFFAAVAFGVLRAGREIDAFDDRLRPAIEDNGERLAELSAQIARYSALARDRVESLEPIVDRAARKAERATETLDKAARAPFVPVRRTAALFKGLREGFETYRRLGATPRKNAARTSA